MKKRIFTVLCLSVSIFLFTGCNLITQKETVKQNKEFDEPPSHSVLNNEEDFPINETQPENNRLLISDDIPSNISSIIENNQSEEYIWTNDYDSKIEVVNTGVFEITPTSLIQAAIEKKYKFATLNKIDLKEYIESIYLKNVISSQLVCINENSSVILINFDDKLVADNIFNSFHNKYSQEENYKITRGANFKKIVVSDLYKDIEIYYITTNIGAQIYISSTEHDVKEENNEFLILINNYIKDEKTNEYKDPVNLEAFSNEEAFVAMCDKYLLREEPSFTYFKDYDISKFVEKEMNFLIPPSKKNQDNDDYMLLSKLKINTENKAKEIYYNLFYELFKDDSIIKENSFYKINDEYSYANISTDNTTIIIYNHDNYIYLIQSKKR